MPTMETRASDRFNSLMNDDPAKLSLSNFLAGESDDPLQAPASFTNWMRVCAWAAQLYEPELLASADARTVINYGGKPRPVINLCSYNYLGLANHPEVLAAAHEALRTHGMGACGSPMVSGQPRSLASKTVSRCFMELFLRLLARWEASSPVPKRHCNTCGSTRILMFTRERCHQW